MKYLDCPKHGHKKSILVCTLSCDKKEKCRVFGQFDSGLAKNIRDKYVRENENWKFKLYEVKKKKTKRKRKMEEEKVVVIDFANNIYIKTKQETEDEINEGMAFKEMYLLGNQLQSEPVKIEEEKKKKIEKRKEEIKVADKKSFGLTKKI